MVQREKAEIGITGSSGVLGTILCEKLKNSGVDFSCFDGDLRSKSDIAKWLCNSNLNKIIHLGAIVPTKEVCENPLDAFDVNVSGTINLLSELKKIPGEKWFFYASTSHVYKSSNIPISEDGALEPVSLYGKTKLMAEIAAFEAGKVEKYNFKVCIGRIFSFYHKTQKPPFLYPTILKRLKEEDLSRDFFLYGANSVRDFLNAQDVVDIIIKLMEKQSTGIFNIASGKGIKIEDFVRNLSDCPLKITTNEAKDFLVANIDKLKNELGLNNE